LITGAGRYVGDMDIPDCLEVAFVRSTVAHGRLVGVDTSAAAKVDGVVAVWSAAGIAGHLGLSQLFGFDPYRTRIAEFAPSHVRYIDRWELKLGQATLSLLGAAVVAAHWTDPHHFVTAVVSATLAAWTYFVLRLYVGGYDLPAKVRAG